MFIYFMVIAFGWQWLTNTQWRSSLLEHLGYQNAVAISFPAKLKRWSRFHLLLKTGYISIHSFLRFVYLFNDHLSSYKHRLPHPWDLISDKGETRARWDIYQLQFLFLNWTLAHQFKWIYHIWPSHSSKSKKLHLKFQSAVCIIAFPPWK